MAFAFCDEMILDAEEIFPSGSELKPDISRLGGQDDAKVEEEHSCNFGTDDSSSEETGIKSGHVRSLSLVGEDVFDFILIDTSAN